MINPEDKLKEMPSHETEKPVQTQPEKTPAEMRQERLTQINQELSDFNSQTNIPEEIQRTQERREQEYQSQLAELETGLGQKLSDESTEMIHANLVNSVIEQAQKENERFDTLTEERKKLTLYNNLELGENAEEVISKARVLIAGKDSDGSKIKAFEKAIDYYSQSQETLADTPIYHSTGSYGLAKILEHGALESKKNIATGEQAATGEEIDTTSFVIGGYDQSETVSYFYARKNERQNKLALDKQNITGIGCEEDIVKTVFTELPQLNDKEQGQVKSAIATLKGDRKITDKELMAEKMRGLQERKYYFDPEQAQQKLNTLKVDLKNLEKEGDQWKIDKKKQEIAKLENGIRTYENESIEMQQEMTDPFPVVLIYEGKKLPTEDLTTMTSGLVSERRTKQPIENSQLKQIQVPQNEIDKATKWLKTKIDSLLDDSPEKKALSEIKIVPLEFFEAKSIIKEIK